jgi:succinylglutamate desuccinylase
MTTGLLEASEPASQAPSRPPLPERLIGRYSTGRPGPTVVLIGGIHGNEPAGPRAVAVVLERLVARALPLRGEVVGLRGNRRALAAGRRFLDHDLNRRWSPERIAALTSGGPGEDGGEAHEQRELLAAIVPLLAEARESIVFLDLHSTSGPGAPFTCMADVLRNRPVAFAQPVPLILGIEEVLEGSLLGYLCDLGHVAVALEGGQSDDPRTARRHEAAIWIALVAAGALDPEDVPDLPSHRALLASSAAGLPPVVELRHRHPIREGDGFVMEPGFASFMPVKRGQVLASDRRGAIQAPEAGLMLMPLYQGQGDDGFFLARAVAPFWLRLSALLRLLRVDRLVAVLPGVSRHPEHADRFLVDPRVARFQLVNLFHLLGYRHVRERSEGVVFSRRRPGFHGLRELPPELRPFLEPRP